MFARRLARAMLLVIFFSVIELARVSCGMECEYERTTVIFSTPTLGPHYYCFACSAW